MTIKRRRTTIAMTAATGTKDVGLGAAFGRVFKVELKGDDANVDSNTTFAITDAEGRAVLVAKAVDAGTDDSSTLATSQDYSTVGVGFYLVNNEADAVGVDGVATTDNVGAGGQGVIAKSPVTIDLAAGTSGDNFEVTLFVEV